MNQVTGGGGVDPYTAGTLALLTDTARAGRGGYGYGGGGEGGYNGGPFATPSANAVRIDRNNEAIHDFRNHQDTGRVCDALHNGFDRLTLAGNASEFRTNDRLRDIEREASSNAREAAKCCCETKSMIAESELRLGRQACEDKSQILAAIAASESRNVERALNAANAELTALKTQVACGCNCSPCGGHHRGGGRRAGAQE